MINIPVLSPVYVSKDNQSVLVNSSVPESHLQKEKNQSIAYHFVREGVARDEWVTSYLNTHNNEDNLLTRIFPSGNKKEHCIFLFIHQIFREACKCETNGFMV